jgi:hypothetical protein
VSPIVQNETTNAPAPTEAPVRGQGRVMRVLAVVLAVAGALLLGFGWWGTHTAAARFGDGFVPIGAGSLGGMLLIAGILVDIVAERRSRKAAR